MAEFGRPDRHRKDVQNAEDPDLARTCHLEIIFHDKYIGDFERVLGWQHLVVQTDTDKMSRML